MRKQHPSINLINETQFLAKDLKKFFAIVLKNHNSKSLVKKVEVVTVKCINSRKNVLTYEYVSNGMITMKLPKEIALYNQSDSLRVLNDTTGIFEEASEERFGKESFEIQVAKFFQSALKASRGNYTPRYWSDILKNESVDYLPANLKIREKNPVVKVKKTPDTKLVALKALRKNWESKMKRCENAIKKLDKKIKYYEKKKIDY